MIMYCDIARRYGLFGAILFPVLCILLYRLETAPASPVNIVSSASCVAAVAPGLVICVVLFQVGNT